MDKFERHGLFEITVNGNILVTSLYGAWNEEAAVAFSLEFKAKAAEIKPPDWGLLALLEQFEGGIPAADVIFLELVDWCVLNQLKASAHVYNKSAYKKDYLNKLISVPPSSFTKSAFQDTKQAVDWLKQMGFTLERPEMIR